MDPIARALRLARQQYGAISNSQARECELTRDQVRQLVRAGRLAPARRGVYIVRGTPDTWEQRASVALLYLGEAALCGRSAACILGVLQQKPVRIEVAVKQTARNRKPRGLLLRRVTFLERRDVRTIGGLRVTCPARTLVDLAGVASDRELGRAVDTALLRGLVTIAVVRRYIRERRLQRSRGVGRLIKLLDDREFGVPESELERRTLELIAEYRLPRPQRQQRIGPHRVDFMYDRVRLVVEVDGRATHGTSDAFEEDPVRQNALVLQGWAVLRFTWKQVTQDPEYVASTLAQALGP